MSKRQWNPFPDGPVPVPLSDAREKSNLMIDPRSWSAVSYTVNYEWIIERLIKKLPGVSDEVIAAIRSLADE